jgi:AcrR family transcriptional regulator
MADDTGTPTLRERKREKTRAAIVDAAMELFETRGYDGTTVADIAAAAEIGTRTFFSYFASKDDLLFPGADARVIAALDAIASRGPHDRPSDVLLRALRTVIDGGHDFADKQGALRFRLIQTVPAVRGRALQLQLDAQREIARHLQAAYPDELDEVTAGAIVGALVGAITGAVQAMTDAGAPADPEGHSKALQRAADIALHPWRDG